MKNEAEQNETNPGSEIQAPDTDNQYNLNPFETDFRKYEWSEKVYRDTLQFFDGILGYEQYTKWNNLCNPKHPTYDKEASNALNMLAYEPGKKLILEITITNTWMSRMLNMLIYSQSEFGKQLLSPKPKFEPLGFTLDSIHWGGIYSISDSEKAQINDTINLLRSKLDSADFLKEQSELNKQSNIDNNIETIETNL